MTPVPVPVRGTGDVVDGAELRIEGDRLLPTRKPELDADADDGLFSPRHQASTDLSFKLPRWTNVTGRLIYTHMFRRNATQLTPVEIQDRDGMGFGAGGTVTTDTGMDSVVLGFAAELYIYRLPYVNGSGPDMSFTPGAAFGVLPTYKTEYLAWFGGLTFRSQPTIDASGTVTTTDRRSPSVGSMAVVLSTGLELELVSGLKGRLAGHLELLGEPVRYGPHLQAGVVIPLPEL